MTPPHDPARPGPDATPIGAGAAGTDADGPAVPAASGQASGSAEAGGPPLPACPGRSFDPPDSAGPPIRDNAPAPQERPDGPPDPCAPASEPAGGSAFGGAGRGDVGDTLGPSGASPEGGEHARRRVPLRLRSREAWAEQRPTWRDAGPALIAETLKRAQARPSGNWFVLGASDVIRAGGSRPFGRTVGCTEVVAWRDRTGRLRAGPGACPHLGAPLRHGAVHCGRLVCHWHGLALAGGPFAGWEPYPAHDDGVLVWVRLDRVGGERPTDRPFVPARPAAATAISAVYTGTGRCEPEDIVANRLDPWHGAWFHPYAFVGLTVLDTPPADDRDGFAVEVSFRVAGRAVVPVRAEFTAPGPRTVLMRITEGEGRGSVVETHATPLAPDDRGAPRTAVIEAVVATSDRPGFALARTLAPLVRPLIRTAAGRLWRDDLAYAERRYTLRARGTFPG